MNPPAKMGRPGGISVETTALPGAGRHRAAPACLCLAHPKAISLPGDGRLDRRGRQLRLELQDPPCSAGFHTPFLQEWVRAGTVWKSAPGTGTAQACQGRLGGPGKLEHPASPTPTPSAPRGRAAPLHPAPPTPCQDPVASTPRGPSHDWGRVWGDPGHFPPSPAREGSSLPGELLPASQLRASAVPSTSRANPPGAACTPQAQELELILLKLSFRRGLLGVAEHTHRLEHLFKSAFKPLPALWPCCPGLSRVQRFQQTAAPIRPVPAHRGRGLGSQAG